MTTTYSRRMPAALRGSLARVTRALLVVGLAAVTGCPPTPQTQQAAQQFAALYGTTIASTPPSQVFPPGSATGKWLPLIVPGAQVKNIAGLPSGIVAPSVIELRGWLTEADPNCNGSDPDWHWGFTPDPHWTDSLGINLNQIIHAGNINAFSSTASHMVLGAPQPLYHDNNSVAGWPIIHMELNGVSPTPPPPHVPATSFVGPLRPSSDWGFAKADSMACPGVTWAFNPTNPLSWQPKLKPNQYVRIVGSLVTDEPHAMTAQGNTWLLNNLGVNFLGDTGVTTALQNNWQANFGAMDPNNPARWVEMHPPNVISVLNDVDASGNATKQPVENVTAVTVYSSNSAGNCPVGFFCGSTTLTIGLAAPGPATPGGLQVMECVGSETNFNEISSGTKDANGKFIGASITVSGGSATVKVGVRASGVGGAPGKFKAIYRTGWKGVAPSTAPPGCTMH